MTTAARTSLPEFEFEKGVCFLRNIPRGFITGPFREFLLIGRFTATGVPFLLDYRDGGLTSWWCEDRLADNLRKSILNRLRRTIRFTGAMPAFVQTHDLRQSDAGDREEALRVAERLHRAFFDKDWRADTLGDRDEDYVALNVPFAQKDAVKALGAKWNGKAWLVNRRKQDMTLFHEWMPPASP
jgi:hypothetical protein